ncbi:MAG: S41 family peptidase [Bacteroidales bacterium]|nr:S41 family peptidase [Bacteroidales bacterium]MDD4711852.1 S41 family peptidase [Bacteroidales bacterium]
MKRTALLLILIFSLSACHEEVNESTDSKNIFETLWSILDEKYCFFDAKGVDWDQVHDKYALRVDTCKNSDSLLKVLGEMICTLQDGHVNLYTAHDLIRYWKWFEDYEPNFDKSLQRNLLGTDYQISSGLKYKIIGGNVGYITYSSFSSAISNAGLDYIFKYFENCRGIIIDVRDNSGGNLSNVNKLACRFTEEKFICGYIRHKTGPGHNDFSEPYPIYLEPYQGKRYTKKVVILTNRMCYSATNTFVTVMRQLPNVIIMGDRTGGGGGFPISSMLPNGWSIRFSSCPTYDENYKLTEEGIEPDSTVYLTDHDIQRGVDVIIETAYSLLQRN